MAYTVNALAKLSGVSVRTLHWYDAIGLLKPAYCGVNQYRYYEEAQLLQLQQILFFKELGFPLREIQTLLSQADFNQLEALRQHRQVLEKEVNRKQQLLTTIEKTIRHLEGRQAMQDEELYYGFDKKFPKTGTYVITALGTPAEAMLAHFKKDEEVWSDAQWADFKNQVDTLDRALTQCLVQGLSPQHETVQRLVQEHYVLQSHFFNLSKVAYLALIDLYETASPEFKQFFEAYHPELQVFLCDAMKIYAEKNL